MKTLVVIPTYNALPKLQEILLAIDNNIPFIVINDGSTDKTYEFLKSTNSCFINSNQNQGVSKSILKGINYAQQNGFNTVITMDSDGQHEVKHIIEYCEKLQAFDFVCGNRFRNRIGIPQEKIAANYFASRLVKECLGKSLPDVSCGFRGYWLKHILDCYTGQSYELIYDYVFKAIMSQFSIGIVEMKAIYFDYDEMSTRQSELESLLNALHRFSNNAMLTNILKKVKEKNNFNFNISESSFSFKWVAISQSYVINTDLSIADNYYNNNCWK